MRNRSVPTLGLVLILAFVAVPNRAAAQDTRQLPIRVSQEALQVPDVSNAVLFQRDVQRGDSLANGMLIGAGIGAAIGMLVLPQTMCGGHDTECATIVRAAVGLPILAYWDWRARGRIAQAACTPCRRHVQRDVVTVRER